MKVNIECRFCGKRYECGVGESPLECAKRHKLCFLQIMDHKGNSEAFFLCQECARIFFTDFKAVKAFRKVYYLKNGKVYTVKFRDRLKNFSEGLLIYPTKQV